MLEPLLGKIISIHSRSRRPNSLPEYKLIEMRLVAIDSETEGPKLRVENTLLLICSKGLSSYDAVKPQVMKIKKNSSDWSGPVTYICQILHLNHSGVILKLIKPLYSIPLKIHQHFLGYFTIWEEYIHNLYNINVAIQYII